MQIKKYVATGLSAVMAGATLAGAALAGASAATPLSDYPSFLGNEGQIDAFVVVGADAEPADIVGSGDIVAGLSSLSYTMVGSGMAGTTTTTGGDVEDMNIGTSFEDVKAFGTTIEDNKLPALADSEVTISIAGNSETYDFHEEIRFTSAISTQTGLSADSPDEDFKTDVFLETTSTGAIEYRYVFDSDLKTGTFIINASNDDPVSLKFMGRDLFITRATATSLTVDVGERFFLNAGETATTSDGVVVTLEKAISSGSREKAQITVNGKSDILSENDVRHIGGIEVKVTDIANDDGIEFDSAVLIVATKATQNQASDTFVDGEEYIIPCGTLWKSDGCDKDDPDWVWNLINIDSSRPTLGVQFNARLDAPSDKPPVVGEEGNSVLDLPDGFAWISLDSLSTKKYQDYEITKSRENLRDANGISLRENAHVIKFKGNGNEDAFQTMATKRTDSLYFEVNNTGSVANGHLNVYYKDHDDGNKIKQYLSMVNSAGIIPTQKIADIKFESGIVQVDISGILNGTAAADSTVAQLNIHLIGNVGHNTSFYFQETGANTAAFDYVGHSDSDTNKANDILYGSRDISGWEENTMTPDGLIIKDPDSNSGGDRYKISVPSEFGSNDFQVKITIGAAGTTTTTSAGTDGIKQFVPITTSLTKLDTEVGTAEKAKNMVLVGGPAINRLTAVAMGLTYPAFGSASGIEEGTALISVIDDAFTKGKVAVIVAGFDASNTRLGTSVLQQAATKLSGVSESSVTVSGTSVASAVITPKVAVVEAEAEEAAAPAAA